ncbi:4537_t:CDS:2, partial [Racocetra fulgida]
MSELNLSNPPKIIASDGIAQIEVFSANESNTKGIQYCKGFINGNETSKTVDLIVKGGLPTWLKGEFFTVGPSTYDIKYTKMIGTEEGYESELDAYDLTPTRVFSWDELDPMVKGDHASPHSHFDEATGELINFNMEYHTM